MQSCGGQTCTYDAVGNPTSYRGKTLTWTRGRKLVSYGNVQFAYDAQGKRLSKNTTKYYYNSANELIASSDGMEYFYGSAGLIGFVYAGQQYVYRKNLQGDIIAILDSNGTVVVQYVYDAWGESLVLDAEGNEITAASHVGQLNPFRYRGYFYDVETGLYYLQSRYYDPEMGRFLNMDSVDYADPETLNGLNLYAYCENDPVSRYDPTGNAWDVVLDVGFIIWDIYNLFTNKGWKDEENWATLGVDIAFAVLPFLTGGGGQIIKLANVADDVSDFKKVTVVGETMTRVQIVSQFVNATDNIYGGYKMYDSLKDLGKYGKVLAEIGGKIDNLTWLYGKLRKGYTIIDIGIDIGRTARSSSYFVERVLLNIWKYRNIWKLLYHIS